MCKRVAVHIGDLVREAAMLCDENKKFQELLSKGYDKPSRLYVELDEANVRFEIQSEMTDNILRMLLNENKSQLTSLRGRIIALYDDMVGNIVNDECDNRLHDDMVKESERDKHDVELVEYDNDDD